MGSRAKYGLSGLTWADLKKHKAIIPLYVLGAFKLTLSAAHALRLLRAHPEISIRRHSNPEPWNEYACKQYKYFSAGRDYSECTPAPRYR